MNKALFAALPLFILTACASLYSSAVTTTEIIDSAMTQWADMSVAGRTTPQIDEKVVQAHFKYQQACALARDALRIYQNGGDQAAYQKAFEAAKSAMNGLLNIIVPLLTPTKAVELQSKAGRVTKP